jgi:hypothetical protein
MRAIVNMMSNNVAKAAGWRAREIRVEKQAASVEDIFRAVTLADGTTNLFDLVSDGDGLKPTYVLYVGGELLRGACNWQRSIIDSEQIHVADWPMTDS